MDRFSFLKIEWPEIYQAICNAEEKSKKDSNTTLIKLAQIVELITKYILKENHIETNTELLDSINLLKDCNNLNSYMVDLFYKIIVVSNKAIYEDYSDQIIAKSFLDKMFEILVWFAIEYGKRDYRKVDLSNMIPKDKDIFNKYIKSKSYNDTEKNIENETIIKPFTINNEEFFKEENNTDINRYEQDVFETKEEFYKRIKNDEIFSLGRVFIEKSNINETDKVVAFPFSIYKSIQIKIPIIDMLYIEKAEFENLSIEEEEYTVFSKLYIIDDKICIDINNIYIEVNNNKCKVHAVVLDISCYESYEKYRNIIYSKKPIPIGMIKLNKNKYDINKNEMPITINYYDWIKKYILNTKAYIEIDRYKAKTLCKENLYYTLNGRLDIFNKKLLIRDYYIQSKSLDKNFKIKLYNSDPMNKLRCLVDKEEIFAMNSIGEMYYKEQNYKEAMYWYKKASDKGNSTSMSNIGFMYYKGKGVEQDYKKAMEWYSKASQAGNFTAMGNIGFMYYNGQGVKQDYKKAMYWYKKSYKEGSSGVMRNIGSMYYEGKGVIKDYKKAMQCYKKASQIDNFNFIKNISDMYYEEKERK
ncbi:tetratricopeptide repeat family protein [Clostridium sporogenes]|uniref:Tetratricopeptide repeat family protein n=1 Tax=Clostridium sporogenes TaxID=1509 RepID=A0A1L3NJE4_CLOSG|nr:tetratricopeptide repeat protein [Clostridium sporogenes]APH16262.1 tetratricopeptide repeat family protein [Clostridium sporogenes]